MDNFEEFLKKISEAKESEFNITSKDKKEEFGDAVETSVSCLATFYTTCRSYGFSDEQSFELTTLMFMQILGNS